MSFSFSSAVIKQIRFRGIISACLDIQAPPTMCGKIIKFSAGLEISTMEAVHDVVYGLGQVGNTVRMHDVNCFTEANPPVCLGFGAFILI